MPLFDQIRDLIGSYYDGEIGVREFRENFGTFFVRTDQSDPETENLAIAIEGTFAEYVSHLIEEDELKNRLFNLAPSIRVQVQTTAQPAANVWQVTTTTTTENRPSPVSPSPRLWRSTGSLPQFAEPCLH